MNIFVYEKNGEKRNCVIEWLIYMLGYSLVFLLVSKLFDSFYLDTEHGLLYAFLAVIIVSVLNTTIKPILVWMTLPITAITLGVFYPFINVFILKIADLILGSHFELGNILIVFFIAILISILNLWIEALIIKPIIRRIR